MHVLRITWGMEYSVKQAKQQLKTGMDDPRKMGDNWSVSIQDCGRPIATYLPDNTIDCDRMLCQIMQWKYTDSSAFSDILSDGVPVRTGVKADRPLEINSRDMNRKKSNTSSLIGWVVPSASSLPNNNGTDPKTFKYPSGNRPIKSKNKKGEDDKLVKITAHFGIDHDERIEKAAARRNGSLNMMETEAMHKRIQKRRFKPTKPPRYVTENVPTSEWEIKREKIQDVTSYALRHGLYDMEIRKRSEYFERWQELRKEYKKQGVHTWYHGGGFHLDGPYIGPTLLHIGDGRFYNGYYEIEKRDWYSSNMEPIKLSKIDYRPYRVVTTYFGKEFPHWADFWKWYWDETPGPLSLTGLSGREILDHDPRDLDSQGDTLSDWTWANSRWCPTPWDTPSISSHSSVDKEGFNSVCGSSTDVNGEDSGEDSVDSSMDGYDECDDDNTNSVCGSSTDVNGEERVDSSIDEFDECDDDNTPSIIKSDKCPKSGSESSCDEDTCPFIPRKRGRINKRIIDDDSCGST